jgi:hypothetical protein
MKYRKTLAVIVGLATATAVGFAPVTASAESSDVATYRKTLAAQADDSAGAASVLRQFDDLDKADQQKFVELATDPDVLTSALGSADQKASGKRTTALAGGDVEVTVENVSKKSSAKGSAGTTADKGSTKAASTLWDVRTESWFSQKILGITVTKLVQEYYYQTRNGNVVSSKSCIDSHVNYNAAVAISSNTSHSTWGNHGQCTTIWTGNIVFKGFGIDMDKKQYLEVDGSGVYSKYLENV